jgi:hypothetical protein
VKGCRVAPPRRHDRGTTGTPFVLRCASSGRARLALPPEERLVARAASIEAKWVMHPAEVSAEETKAAQRAAMTRIEVVEAVREITVEVRAARLTGTAVRRGRHPRHLLQTGHLGEAAGVVGGGDTTGRHVAAPDARGGSERAGLDDLLALVVGGLKAGVEVLQRRLRDGQRVGVPGDQAPRVGLGLQLYKDLLLGAVPLPAPEQVVGAVPRSVPLRHVAPRRTGPGPPPYAVDQLPPPPRLRPARLLARRQQRLQPDPLAVVKSPRPTKRDHPRP